ncbi:hypothetical protein [Natronomonas sp.]|uniref:hypothetical protein n=1 Tax=Natronomonas sp. TaxID=2184060 RepID=UPI00398A0B76
MSGSNVVEAGEYTADELLERLREGERLVVQTEVLGNPEELTLRFDGDIYYCDSPTTLHKHEDEAEMRSCMQHYGYVRDD